MAGIYTKRGDQGETSLYGGSRVPKDDPKVNSYGTLDEANSMLGMAYSLLKNEEIKNYVREIQKKIFIAGAELASDEKGMSMLKEKIGSDDIAFLESIVDKCYETVGKQTEFVIPGVNSASAALHVARTIVRRAERSIASLNNTQMVRPELSKFVNRLSDAIYSMARYEETMQEIQEIKEVAKKLLSESLGQAGMRNENEAAESREIEFSLENIKLLAEYAEEKAKEIGVPIVFSAVDSGGNLILLHRMENSLLGSIDISINKAFTANAFKMPTQKLAAISVPTEDLYGIQNTNNGKIVIFAGGYPYQYKGTVQGGIGVSGGSVEEDMCIAEYALNKLTKRSI